MSAHSSIVTADHFRYLAARTTGDDAFLRQLKRDAAQAGIPAIWIAPEEASFLQILLRCAGAREVVEVGTLAGYSAIAMARALPADGRVRTIEVDPAHAEFAERQVAASDVADKVQVLRGDGATILASLEARSVDACFLDADKKSYPVYLEHARRIVRPGGLILVDNAFAFGQLFDPHPTDPEVGAVRQFNDLMARSSGLHGVIVPLGDGLWVAVTEP